MAYIEQELAEAKENAARYGRLHTELTEKCAADVKEHASQIREQANIRANLSKQYDNAQSDLRTMRDERDTLWAIVRKLVGR